MSADFCRKAPWLLLAALAVPLAGCGKKEEAREAPRPALTLVAKPSPALDVALSGTVQPQVQSPLGFRVMGRMISRPIKAGDRVEAGQMLAAVDPLALELAAKSAAASLASARAQYDHASANEARQSALLARKTASQATFDAAEQERAAAQASMAQAEANLAKAREQLSYAVLKADWNGVVTATNAEVGQTVAPGQAVLTLAQPANRDAVIDAPDSVAEALWIGEKFNVSMQIDPALKVTGVVREISPQADSATRMRRIKIALDNPPELLPAGRHHFRPDRRRRRLIHPPSRFRAVARRRARQRLRGRSAIPGRFAARRPDRAGPGRALDRARRPDRRRAGCDGRRAPPQAGQVVKIDGSDAP